MNIPVLAGPTASGKTAAALELARTFPLEVVSADAMMVYRNMDIGTAKPTAAERAQVPHHLIDVVNPDEAFNVADYVRLAETAIGEILGRGRLPLVVGGTGFYIRALMQGLPTVPQADKDVQAPLWERLEQEGVEPLQAELQAFSPQDALRTQRNPRRVVRALEIIGRTGKAPSQFPFTKPAFRYDLVTLLPPMEQLKPRIEARTGAMLEQGLLVEVKALLERYPNLATAAQAIGYKELVSYLAGEATLEEAEAAVTLATTQYAKRQRTWFRKQDATKLEAAAGEVTKELKGWLEALQKNL